MMWMPGKSYRGPIPALTSAESALRDALRRDVGELAGTIGERNLSQYHNLRRAAAFIETSFTEAGLEVHRQGFTAEGNAVANLEAALAGTEHPEEIVVIGAHYDSVDGSPGANDNATGVAAVLALARAFAGARASRTLRFVAFVNEEPPYFQTPVMGSLVYAARCQAGRERVVAMLSLETIGYYADARGSQSYPFPFQFFYPSQGNFIGFVGNLASRGLLHDVTGSFRRHARHPSEGIAMWESIPGVGWSDQWSFWQQGYPGVMVTDTAFYRYPHYHTPGDTPDKVHYDRLALVVAGLEQVVADLAGRLNL
ncbi:MAG: M28 family peptidase [Candidatus Omnitrophica bacterium]|nr:M28 family peptidase [Candidatus Omnitrophota bacterium]